MLDATVLDEAVLDEAVVALAPAPRGFVFSGPGPKFTAPEAARWTPFGEMISSVGWSGSGAVR